MLVTIANFNDFDLVHALPISDVDQATLLNLREINPLVIAIPEEYLKEKWEIWAPVYKSCSELASRLGWFGRYSKHITMKTQTFNSPNYIVYFVQEGDNADNLSC